MTAMMSSLRILQTRSVGDLVRQEIIQLIKEGELKAGDKLNEVSYAEKFNVSRAPIREAFRALEGAGLVKVEKNRGVFVREISEPEARELYELRATLDEMAGRLLAPLITRAIIEELDLRLGQLRAAAVAGDMAQYFSLNISFHDRIVELAGSATLTEFYRNAMDRMHLLRRLNFSEGQGSDASQEEHRTIVAALATGEPAAAAAAMRQHVLNGYSRLGALALTGRPAPRPAAD
jgi:DNA-binding GntR family transcriptional regulator